ncbi:MAG TPA: flagellar basal body rod protein FlgC [Ramlibacter sp.]|jgi:flagellar basal-body rod protein FlgC|uniref:flagellar basal body rod protein FlgC n=1 Tax=Ramlibacter sp. TaxID=1917967 RepID=UPI002D70BC4C|nr:flagellar basal body rod protein FlgC [Ramlibacter sp.]HZY20749.1 flagellar basal body rod protein FlgC [Ramlibacter sp.]
MDYLQSFAVSAAGMAVERTRVEVAAMNLANANTVQDPATAGYRPLRVLALAAHAASFGSLVDSGLEGAGLPTASVEPMAVAPRLAPEPGHPLANVQGLVAYPAVDTAAEMVSMMSATRAYEANVAALNTARTLALKALEIGRNA